MTLGSGESRGAEHTPLFFDQSEARREKFFTWRTPPLTSSSDTVYMVLRLALLRDEIEHR